MRRAEGPGSQRGSGAEASFSMATVRRGPSQSLGLRNSGPFKLLKVNQELDLE